MLIKVPPIFLAKSIKKTSMTLIGNFIIGKVIFGLLKNKP